MDQLDIPDPVGEEEPAPRGFELLGELGRGGFSVVHRARRGSDGSSVALKIADTGAPARDMLLRERRMLERIGPPLVPAVLDAGRLGDGRPWLALELIAWPSLRDRLRASGRFAAADALAIARPVAAAIAQLHERGLVHGDIKPGNIMVAPDRSAARLIDFGLARRLDEGGRAPHEPDSRPGTPPYMAPEQCAQSSAISRATDVYALGVILHQLLAGACPFEGPAVEVQQAHIARRPPPLPIDVPCRDEIGAWVRRCLAKRPGDRPSAAEVVQALDRLARSVPASGSTSAAPVAATGASRPAADHESRRMGILAFEPRGDAARLMRLIAATGGRIGHADGRATMILFDPDSAGRPLRRVVQAARELHREGVLARAVAGIAEVSVLVRGGRELVLSPAFADPRLLPSAVPEDWLAVLPEAESLAADLALVPVPRRELSGICLAEDNYATLSGAEPTIDAPLLGRELLIDAVVDRCTDALAAGEPALEVVLGEAGMGKTLIATALLARLARAAPVIGFRADETLLGDPFQLTREVLRAICELPSELPADADAQSCLRQHGVSEAAWPAVAVAVGWLDPRAPEASRLAAAPGALRSLVADALARALVARARDRGLVLLLDDVQHCDDAVLDALDAAILPEHRVGLVVVALGRQLPEGREALGRRAARARRQELEPLEREAAVELVFRLLGPNAVVPRSAVEHMVARAGANPGLLVELVRGLERAGILHRRGRTSLSLDQLDEVTGSVVEWSAGWQLRALAPALAAHARLAALIGGAFSVDEMDGILAELDRAGSGALAPLDARVAARRLGEAGLLHAAGPDRLDFRNPLVRDAIARATPADLAAAVHAAAHRYYASASGPFDATRRARLAHHAERAGDRDAAIAGHLSLGHEAATRHLYLVGATYLGRALALLEPDDRRRPIALRDRGALRVRLGRYADALDDFDAALAGAAEPGQEGDLLLQRATALDWTEDYAGSRAAAERAEAVLAGVAGLPDRLALELQVARGRTLLRSGDLTAARAELARALELTGRIDPDDCHEPLIVTLLLLGPLLAMVGLADEAAPLLERARVLCEARSDRMHLIGVLANDVLVYMARRDLDGALGAVARARGLSRELGLVGSEYRQAFNLAELCVQAGRTDEALRYARAAEDLAGSLAVDGAAREVALLRARAHLLDGDLAAAARISEELTGAPGDTAPAGDELILRAVRLAFGDYQPERWRALVDEAGDRLAEQSDLVEVLYQASLAAARAGDRSAAVAHLARCRAAEASALGLYPLRRDPSVVP